MTGRALKCVVYAQVFTAGFAVMALELLGSRLLAPTFGSSIFVWGSLIGVFLLSMAAGYYAGGRLSMHSPSAARLAALSLAAALYVLTIPWIFKPICESADRIIPDERWGALVATMAVFSLPLCLFGAVSPYSIRLVSRSVETVGDSAGALYAVSTVGSFLGTIITAFFLIPAFPTSGTVLTLGAIIAAFSAAVMVADILSRKQKSD